MTDQYLRSPLFKVGSKPPSYACRGRSETIKAPLQSARHVPVRQVTVRHEVNAQNRPNGPDFVLAPTSSFLAAFFGAFLAFLFASVS